MNTTTESEKNASAPEIPQPKTKRAAARKARAAKKSRAKKPAAHHFLNHMSRREGIEAAFNLRQYA